MNKYDCVPSHSSGLNGLFIGLSTTSNRATRLGSEVVLYKILPTERPYGLCGSFLLLPLQRCCLYEALLFFLFSEFDFVILQQSDVLAEVFHGV